MNTLFLNMRYERGIRARITLDETIARDAILYALYHTSKLVSHTLYRIPKALLYLWRHNFGNNRLVFLKAAMSLPDSSNL